MALQDFVIPKHYDILLKPDLNCFKCPGTVKIHVEVTKPTKSIIICAREILFTEVNFTLNQGEEKVSLEKMCMNPKLGEVELIFSKEISGEGQLVIKFESTINDKMAGLYRTSYERRGKKIHAAVTQFEENDARRAFPCFDHPAKKATFDVSFVIDEKLVGISNGDVIEEKSLGNGKKLVKFRRTPKMSTYLLFFGIGDFQFLQNVGSRPDDVIVRVATLPGKIRQAKFALSFARKVLNYCQNYFAFPYPLRKLDNIAVPDFAFGAMENWGAILYREDAMLYDRKTTSFSGKKRVCEVIAHEIAHQWFGDLVSPLKWKYIWLNESFATWFAYKIVSSLFPKWKLWDDFILGETVGALYRDSYIEDVPIELPGDDDSTPEFNASIIPIIYNKGGTILRMLEDYLGEKQFREGLRHYMKKHQYDNASSEDLWQAIEEVTKEPVVDLMKSWVEQPGVPIVHVEQDDGEIILQQERFTYLPSDARQTWIIPIKMKLFYADGTSKTKKTLLKGKEKRIKASNLKAIKVNYGQAGYYRVNYSQELLSELTTLIKEKKLPPEDRWGLHNDYYALMIKGEITLDQYLDFVEQHYSAETDYLPAIDIIQRFMGLYIYFKNTNKFPRIQEVITKFLEHLLAEIGMEPRPNEKPSIPSLRQSALSAAVIYRVEAAISHLKEKYEEYKKTKAIQPDIRVPSLLVGAISNDEAEFDWMIERHSTTNLEHERVALLQGLAAFEKESLIKKYLDFVVKEVPMRNQGRAISFLAMNPASHEMLWPWFKDHQATFEKIHPNIHESIIMSLIRFAFLPYKEEIKQFLDGYAEQFPRFKDSFKLGQEIMKVIDRFVRANT